MTRKDAFTERLFAWVAVPLIAWFTRKWTEAQLNDIGDE